MQSICIEQRVTRFHAGNIKVICQQDVHLPVLRHGSDIFITRSRIFSQAAEDRGGFAQTAVECPGIARKLIPFFHFRCNRKQLTSVNSIRTDRRKSSGSHIRQGALFSKISDTYC